MRDIFDVPGVGRIAIVRDPTGAVVGWMTSAPSPAEACRHPRCPGIGQHR